MGGGSRCDDFDKGKSCDDLNKTKSKFFCNDLNKIKSKSLCNDLGKIQNKTQDEIQDKNQNKLRRVGNLDKIQAQVKTQDKTQSKPQNKAQTQNDSCFCFDIDDTLIYTNLANFLAYQKAIYEVKATLISPTLLKSRCDKTILSKLKLNKQESSRVKALKDRHFKDFLPFTKINYLLLYLMQILCEKHKVILLTNAKPQRIELLVKYHKLKNLPTIFYNPQKNKYQNCIEKFGLNAEFITIFEDSDKEIKHAKKAGICNIIKI